MKIHGKKKKNYILEVTPLELGTIQSALFEYSACVSEGPKDAYNKRFLLVFDRISKTAIRFDLLKPVSVKLIASNKELE